MGRTRSGSSLARRRAVRVTLPYARESRRNEPRINCSRGLLLQTIQKFQLRIRFP